MTFRLLFVAILLTIRLAAAQTVTPQGEPLSRIAFGSCLHQWKPAPIWESIVAARPQAFLFIGDNVYADTLDPAVMRQKYGLLAAMTGYQKLRAVCPVLATWDDHDFGANDAGADYPMKRESQRIFLDFFGDPPDSPRRAREGVYDARLFGPPGKQVQIILLDTRYFRSPLPRAGQPSDANATMLGDAQWAWLEAQLRVPAQVRLLVSSVQVVSNEHSSEKWGNFPLQRDKLFDVIARSGAEGIVFLSGDRHLAELSMLPDHQASGYPLYDLTSSGLNSAAPNWRPLEANRFRVAAMNWGHNFGLIEIDWQRPDPWLSLQIRDEGGSVRINQAVPLSVLKRDFFARRAAAQREAAAQRSRRNAANQSQTPQNAAR